MQILRMYLHLAAGLMRINNLSVTVGNRSKLTSSRLFIVDHNPLHQSVDAGGRPRRYQGPCVSTETRMVSASCGCSRKGGRNLYISPLEKDQILKLKTLDNAILVANEPSVYKDAVGFC
jgi:hypothetical protein